jgi:hypothetical protein
MRQGASASRPWMDDEYLARACGHGRAAASAHKGDGDRDRICRLPPARSGCLSEGCLVPSSAINNLTTETIRDWKRPAAVSVTLDPPFAVLAGQLWEGWTA